VTLRGIDDLDRLILWALQTDARNASSREIATLAGVSASTVRKRIKRLEAEGVIMGYRADVDYQRAGYQLHVQIVCTAPVAERDALMEEVVDVAGVVGVRGLATGERNLVVTVVGDDGDDLTRIAAELSDIGVRVLDEQLVRSDLGHPFSGFETSDRAPAVDARADPRPTPEGGRGDETPDADSESAAEQPAGRHRE
jgi:DNA-binding Lrp family transcriptional regulator